jgi:cobalt/nickel transport system permease protein
MTFDEQYFNMGRLDRLSYKDTLVHNLDPRAKVIATMLFLFTVISFPKYEVVALVPFFLFPVLLMTIGEIPVWFIFKKVILVSPFAIFIGIFSLPGYRDNASSPGYPYRPASSPASVS